MICLEVQDRLVFMGGLSGHALTSESLITLLPSHLSPRPPPYRPRLGSVQVFQTGELAKEDPQVLSSRAGAGKSRGLLR